MLPMFTAEALQHTSCSDTGTAAMQRLAAGQGLTVVLRLRQGIQHTLFGIWRDLQS